MAVEFDSTNPEIYTDEYAEYAEEIDSEEFLDFKLSPLYKKMRTSLANKVPFVDGQYQIPSHKFEYDHNQIGKKIVPYLPDYESNEENYSDIEAQP